MDVVVLAGGKSNRKLFEETKVKYKAFVKINNRFLVEYVLDAFLESRRAGNIYLFIDENSEFSHPNPKVKVIKSSRHPIDNISSYAEQNNRKDNFIISTCDIPLINSSIVDAIIEKTGQLNYNAVCPLVTRKSIEQSYPSTKRTYVCLKEGVFCSGNIFIANPSVILNNKKLVKQFFDKRKSVLFMAGKLGLGFLLRYMLKTADLKLIMNKMKNIIGEESVGELVCDYPEICIDLDKPEDYRLIRQILERKNI